MKLHPDGFIASARASFMAELKKGRSFAYRLLPEKPTATESKCEASRERRYPTLGNGLVRIRLPKEGEERFRKPAPLASESARRASVPGPFQGLGLLGEGWVGGSLFWAEKPEEAPRVTEMSCKVTTTSLRSALSTPRPSGATGRRGRRRIRNV